MKQKMQEELLKEMGNNKDKSIWWHLGFIHNFIGTYGLTIDDTDLFEITSFLIENNIKA